MITEKISDLSLSFKFEGSKEELGRKARRSFLERIAQECQADVIALAHHAQDQQETFFIRLIRGATLSGLTAMKPKQDLYIRPLLETNKEDIIAYLHEHKIPYLTDPSNESPEFLRNRIRLTVLPALKQCDKRFDKNFLATLHRLQETESFLEEITQQALDHITTEENGVLYLAIQEFFNLHTILQKRIILTWLCQEKVPFTPTETFFDEIIRFFRQPGSKTHR